MSSIEKFIAQLRDITGRDRWLKGDCYNLFRLLRTIYPSSEPYHDIDYHIYTKIDEKYYDIDGVFHLTSGRELFKLDERNIIKQSERCRYEN